MNFVATVAASGLAAILLVANLQGAQLPSAETWAGATMVDPIATGSVAAPVKGADAIRLIDLRSGASCRMSSPAGLTGTYRPAPIGADCQGSPSLQRIAKWRTTDDGLLEIADTSGEMLLRFVPGDGVLYESIFPAHAMVTIVPAKG